MTVQRVLIVGGGPGGLALALALRGVGIEPVVVERTPRHGALGAGVSLWPNAMRLLRRWGLGGAIEARGAVAADSAIRTASGRRLVTLDGGRLEARFGAPLVVIHCATLQTILRTALGSDALHLGWECVAVVQDDRRASVVLRGGGRHHADIVVGADGAASTVRATVVGDAPPRYGGITAWRCVVPLDRRSADALPTGEWWGSGVVFGIARLGGNQAYWWTTARCRGTGGGAPGEEKSALLRRFQRWHPTIAELIDASIPEAIVRSPVRSRPTVERRSAGRVALLGDAADLTSPSLAQGACLAIEDAAAMVASLAGGDDASGPAALERYSAARRCRIRALGRRANRLSHLSHTRTLAASGLRNALLRSTSAGAALDWLAPVIGPDDP